MISEEMQKLKQHLVYLSIIFLFADKHIRYIK